MKGLVEVGDMLVYPVNGKRVLKQVVCAYGEKVHLLCEYIRYKRGRRNLYHYPYLYGVVKVHALLLKLPLCLLEYYLGSPKLVYARDHRKHHLDLSISACF